VKNPETPEKKHKTKNLKQPTNQRNRKESTGPRKMIEAQERQDRTKEPTKRRKQRQKKEEEKVNV